MTGLKVDLLADLGSYIAILGGGTPVLGAFMFNAIYKFKAYQFNVQTVLTNKTWTDAYRGAGRPEATFAIERIMDELAAELGVDPLEIREKNWINADEFPFNTVAGMEYDSGNYEAATARAKEMLGYDELRAEQKQRREAGDKVQLGIGVSTFTEMCGLAPSRVLGRCATAPAAGSTRACGCSPTGKVEVITGASAHGQGHETAFSQIVADRLGVPFEDVEVLHGDTQVAAKGLDTYGSRSLVIGGEAIVQAVDKVIEKAKPIAAHLLEANVDDVEFTAGRFGVRGTDQGMAIQEVALATFAAHDFPDGMEPVDRRGRDVRPGRLQLPARHAPVRDGGRHGDRRGQDPQVRLLRRHRQHHQPAHRRRAGARRRDAGDRAGAVGGGGVRRSGTLVSGSFVDYLLPTSADTINFEIDHTTSPSTDQHARHEGRRRGGHDRLDAGGRERRRRRDPAPRGERHPDAVHARARVEGDPRVPAAAVSDATEGAAMPHFSDEEAHRRG